MAIAQPDDAFETEVAHEFVPVAPADAGAAEEADARRLAERYRLEFLDMGLFRIDQELFRGIPAELMLRYGFVPFKRDGRTLVVVVSDPTDLQMIDELAVLLGTPVRVMVGARSAIEGILKKSESSQRVLDDATEDFIQVLKDEDSSEDLTVERLTSDHSPIIRMVDAMVFTAIQRRASDIHIETQDDAVVVKYRIDGVLQPASRPIAKASHSAIISRIKVMAELDIAEKRVPQDGRFRLRVRGKTIDFRVSIMPSAHGEDAVIRILDKQSISEQFTELKLDILGFPELELQALPQVHPRALRHGAGDRPHRVGQDHHALRRAGRDHARSKTRSSPSKTRSSTSCRASRRFPINEKKGLTFARGLRSILRHDPDKIMVGEIRDSETAQIAIQSALTGHLVFTTVHANNVFDVLGRFLNMGVEPYQFISALNCVMAQRLVRKICEKCKQPVRAHARAADRVGDGPGAGRHPHVRRGRRLRRVRRHRLQGPHGHLRTARPDRPRARADSRAAADLGDQARRQGTGHALPARVGGRTRDARPHDAA